MRGDDARSRELEASGIETCRGDLTDPASLRRALAGIDIVYNIGATYRDVPAGLGEP